MDKEKDGIDFILHLNHIKHSILVTARAEEVEIQKRCNERNIKLLPKSAIGQVAVSENWPNVVLIDDEKLTHMDWERFFRKRELPFSSYFSVAEFLENASKHGPDSHIYIDSGIFLDS